MPGRPTPIPDRPLLAARVRIEQLAIAIQRLATRPLSSDSNTFVDNAMEDNKPLIQLALAQICETCRSLIQFWS
jgi:hypothetical protein